MHLDRKHGGHTAGHLDSDVVILLDNGSLRPQAVRKLRQLAARLSQGVGYRIHPVSLLHSDRIPTRALGGHPAATLDPFLRTCLARGQRRFLVLPLFFSRNRGLRVALPQRIRKIRAEFGPLDLRMADPLYPLPEGEPRLVQILVDFLQEGIRETRARRMVLVDHGSADPEVTAVRHHLAEQLSIRFGASLQIWEAVMEHRLAMAHARNGPFLGAILDQLARVDPEGPILLGTLFLLPGRHAGPGGDMERLCGAIRRAYPRLPIVPTPLIGEHPALLRILEARMENHLHR